MRTKADKGKGVDFYCILRTSVMDDPYSQPPTHSLTHCSTFYEDYLLCVQLQFDSDLWLNAVERASNRRRIIVVLSKQRRVRASVLWCSRAAEVV